MTIIYGVNLESDIESITIRIEMYVVGMLESELEGK